MKRLVAAAIVAAVSLMATAAAPLPQHPFESSTPVSARNQIDELVFAQLTQLAITPANLSSDGVFLRRVYLDLIGTLPTIGEAKAFLEDTNPAKRTALVERLLERPEYADYWALKWGDVLRIKSEFPINLWPNAVQAYHRWVHTCVRDNVPYDRFVRDLLTSSGSNFRVAPVNFYRALQSKDAKTIAATVALTFMGSRTERWPQERLAGMSAFFSQVGYKPTGEWKEEIVFFESSKPAAPGQPAPVFPDGTPGRIAANQDPRDAFATWLIAPTNPWFTRAAVNRVWFWMMGRSLDSEPDDIRIDSAAVNPALLSALEKAFVASRYDVKALIRLIANSSTYQLSSIRRSTAAGADAHFAHASLRLLDAEVLVDALNQITGGTEQYQSAIPEPYTFIPPDQRSIALADGSITSAFLETFGRPPRDSGLSSERSTKPTASQRLQLLNGGDVQRKIQQGPKLLALLQAGGGQQTLVNLYLSILSRYPTDDEIKAATAYVQGAGTNRRQSTLDLAWALINSTEFRYRH
jgi:hypothetical protein